MPQDALSKQQALLALHIHCCSDPGHIQQGRRAAPLLDVKRRVRAAMDVQGQQCGCFERASCGMRSSRGSPATSVRDSFSVQLAGLRVLVCAVYMD